MHAGTDRNRLLAKESVSSCSRGVLTASVQCLRAGCTDEWSENWDPNAELNRDCAYSCTTVSARLKVAGQIPALSDPVCLVLEADHLAADHPADPGRPPGQPEKQLFL